MNQDNVPIAKGMDTTFYVPLYQFGIRIVLGILMAVYFFFLPIPFLIFNGNIITFIILSYIAFHVAWWFHFKKKGISIIAIRLANWIDLVGGGIAVLVDPFIIPPTILLIMITVLGNGIQHGLDNFISVSKKAILLCLFIIPGHFYIIGQFPPYSFYFLLLLLLICVHYAYFLVQRIEQLKKKAEDLALRDELTGLLNRRAFDRYATYLISLYNRIHMPLVFVFADLDGFKNINDIKGHAVGDQVLKIFGTIAADTLRQTDISARYGGDEFVFIITNAALPEALNVISRLESKFLSWAKVHDIRVGVSYGAKEISEEKINLSEIMIEIDKALYEEKKKKKGF